MADAAHLDRRARELTLASLLTSYPEHELEAVLENFGDALGRYPGAGALHDELQRAGLDDVRSRYLELFDRGGDRASLYETEYGRMRGMAKGTGLADIAGFYRAFAVGLDDERAHELCDHIAVELEFYAWLLLKQAWLVQHGDDQGASLVEDARCKFLKEHLGSFAPAIALRREVQQDPVYGGVFGWCAALVREECVALGVTPAPLDFFADAELGEEMKCGSVHLPVVG